MPAFGEAPREGLAGERRFPHSNVIFGDATTKLAGATVEGSTSEDCHHESGPQGWPNEKSTILGLLTSLHVADPKYRSSPGSSSSAFNSSGFLSTASDIKCPMVGKLTEDQSRNASPTGCSIAWTSASLPNGISRKGESPRFRLAWADEIGSKRPANRNRRLFGVILIPATYRNPAKGFNAAIAAIPAN
jgi:hypothetical protein